MFRGQQEMFLFDWGYVKDILLHPGGLAEVIARFLTQFFTVSGVGVVVTLVLLGLNAWMVWKLMERTACTGGQFERTVTSTGSVTGKRFDKLSDREVWGIFPLCLLPSVFLAVSLLDYYCFYQGIIAYMAAVFCLLEYSKIKRRPLLWGSVMTIGLFFLTGSVALLFAVRALLFDIFVKRPKALLSVIYPAITLLLGFMLIQAGEIATILDAFTPRMYYEVDILKMPEIHYVSWVMLSVCIFIAAVSRKITVKGF
ncbi:MAG TPA: hypothetical protein DD383_01945, partial [Rikenellaceae bacterium]|nr:hypothetical protein [Rikenellaceae bacterium]